MTNQEFIEKYGEEEGRRRIAKRNEFNRIWRKEHTEYYIEYNKKHRERINANARAYQATRRDKQQEWMQNYHETPEGRAVNLLTSYRQFDTRKFGEVPQLTRFDILTKCFSENSKCVYCGETRWTELGLDRLTNRLPHNSWNTVTCCKNCNNKRNKKTIEEFLAVKGLTFDEWVEQNNGEYSDYMTICY